MLTDTNDQSRRCICLTHSHPHTLTPSHTHTLTHSNHHTLTPSHKHPEKESLNAMVESPSLQNTFQPIAGFFSYTSVHPFTLTASHSHPHTLTFPHPHPHPHITTPSLTSPHPHHHTHIPTPSHSHPHTLTLTARALAHEGNCKSNCCAASLNWFTTSSAGF